MLNLVFQKAKTMNLAEIKKVADTVLKEVSTNVSKTQILSLAAQAASYDIEESIGWPYEVESYQPAGVWYGAPKNLEDQVVRLHQYLFEDEEYEVSQTVKTLSDKLIKQTGIK